jgi:ERCC4-related helicase
MVMHQTLLDKPHQKIIFIGGSVALLEQQKNYFSAETSGKFDQTTAVLYGDMNQTKRINAMKGCRLVFITPQLFYNYLRDEMVDMADIALLVFDEVRRQRFFRLVFYRTTHESATFLFSATMSVRNTR